MNLKALSLAILVSFAGLASAAAPAPRSIEECMDYYHMISARDSGYPHLYDRSYHDVDAAQACVGVYKECLEYTMAQSDWVSLDSSLRACQGNVTKSCVERISALPIMQYRSNNRLDAANVCAGRTY